MSLLKNNLTILVNTSDGFEDCWQPFFFLFKKNWTYCKYPILLNTEFKDYSFEDLEIKASKCHENYTDRKLTWSECLINALNQIESPLILYFQEDYFLDKIVDVDFVEKMVNLMINKPEIKRIGLVTTDSLGELYPCEFPELNIISVKAKYRISTQVAIWRKDTLLSYLKPEENGWMFEIFGTWRSRKKSEVFLTLNRNLFNNSNKIFSYLHTGIIKGKWHPEIPQLFRENNINLDLSKRGFYDLNMPIYKRKIETFRKLVSSPVLFIKAIKGLI